MPKTVVLENATLESFLSRPEIMAIIPGCMRYLKNARESASCGRCNDAGTPRQSYTDTKKCIALLGDSKKRQLMAALRADAIQITVPISGRIKTLTYQLPK